MSPTTRRSPARPAIRGFTILELLTVMTVLAILVAILLPSLGAARKSAQRAQTKARFAQWSAAIEAFRREYGGYPQFDPSALVNGSAGSTGEHAFHDLLAGAARDGADLAATSSTLQQNRRRVAFHRFADGEFADGNLLCDAGENTSIAVLVDRNLDGAIRVGGANADYEILPPVAFVDGTLAGPPVGTAPGDFPAQGLRAGVAFYAPAPGASATMRDFVVSW